MNWTNFLLTLTLVYLAYYGFNMLYDLLMKRKPPKADTTGDLLFFDEDVRPEIVELTDEPEPEPAEIVPPEPQQEQRIATATASPPQGLSGIIHATGGVSIQGLYNLLKDDVIEYTGDISYG
jgi:hypothetical protein